MSNNGRYEPDDVVDIRDIEASQSGSYSDALLLEDLESLREQMDEAGVTDLEQAQRWLDQPASDRARGIPSAADRANLEAVVELMEDLEINTREELENRIRQMQENTSWE